VVNADVKGDKQPHAGEQKDDPVGPFGTHLGGLYDER
jgi:hypothetical protein